MIKLDFIIVFLFPIVVLAQPGPIKMERYNDDFSYLLNDTIRKKGLEKLKYISLNKSKTVNFSVGGEIREWYEIRHNTNFGDVPPGFIKDNDGSLQHRAMLHTDWQFGKRVRVFGQLNNTLEFWNPNPPIPEIIEDGLGLHQAFVEINLGKIGTEKNKRLRLGRQEYAFGNEHLVSSREGPNNRLAFDGATYLQNDSNSHFQLFVATPVIIKPEVFDNTHANEAMWGFYSTFRKRKKLKLDLFYLGYYSERRKYNFIPGFQNRHTLGSRIWNHGRGWWYDAEFIYQTGEFNKQQINAFNFTGEIRYVFQDWFLKPMIGAGLSYVSGDYSSSDNQLNTYDPMYPKPIYGLALPQGPSNIAHVQPMVGVQPIKALFINFRWYYLSRTSNQDGTYTPGMDQVRPIPPVSSDKYGIGVQYSSDIIWIINKNLTFLTFITYATPGEYVKETGVGSDSFFMASMLQFKF